MCGFALTLPATKCALTAVSPWFAVCGRAAAAGVIAAIVVLVTRAPRPTGRDVWGLLVVAAGAVFGFPGFSTLAMQRAPASHGAVIGGILPLATAVAGVVLAHEHPPWRFWIAGLVGSAALVAYALRDGFALHLADVWLVLAVISAAIGYAEGGRLARHLGGWTVIAWALVLSLPIALPLACLTAPPIAAWTPWALGGMAYLALISQLLAFVAWYRGLALGGIARVGQLQLLQPFVTIAASVWLFSEQVTWLMVATLLIVLGSVAVGRGSLRR